MYEKRVYRVMVKVNGQVHGRLRVAADDSECAQRAAMVWAGKTLPMRDSDVARYEVYQTNDRVWVP